MGHTHTKLLAGAFSVLAVMQFFMVYDLSKQVDQFTETAMISSMATVHRVPSQFGSADARAQDRGIRKAMELMRMGKSPMDIVRNRATINVDTSSETDTHAAAPTTPTGVGKWVPTVHGDKFIINNSHAVQEVDNGGLTPLAVPVQ